MAIRFWEIYEETKEKYKLRILAGKNGMDNVTGWVHMLEDETIINRFSGEEPVSYTHLDVYKRQVYADTASLNCPFHHRDE